MSLARLQATRALPVFAALLASWLVSGCSDAPRSPGSGGASSLFEAHPGQPAGTCNALETRYEGGTAQHIAQCAAITYPMSPPVFGDHYPSWAAYRSYDFPLALGFLVHNLEHGGIVLFYNCPDGCADEVAEAQAAIDALPADRRCVAPVKHQIILVPEPTLESRWAAAAWGYALTGDCFDGARFEQFYAAHLGQGPEDVCGDGLPFAANPCQ